MLNIIETLKNINLKETVQRALIDNGAQVVQCERWLDLEYTTSGNTYNNNAPVVILKAIVDGIYQADFADFTLDD